MTDEVMARRERYETNGHKRLVGSFSPDIAVGDRVWVKAYGDENRMEPTLYRVTGVHEIAWSADGGPILDVFGVPVEEPMRTNSVSGTYVHGALRPRSDVRGEVLRADGDAEIVVVLNKEEKTGVAVTASALRVKAKSGALLVLRGGRCVAAFKADEWRYAYVAGRGSIVEEGEG